MALGEVVWRTTALPTGMPPRTDIRTRPLALVFTSRETPSKSRQWGLPEATSRKPARRSPRRSAPLSPKGGKSRPPACSTSRGRRFKSCQPDRNTGSGLRKQKSGNEVEPAGSDPKDPLWTHFQATQWDQAPPEVPGVAPRSVLVAWLGAPAVGPPHGCQSAASGPFRGGSRTTARPGVDRLPGPGWGVLRGWSLWLSTCGRTALTT
jgi:hypothetical protein